MAGVTISHAANETGLSIGQIRYAIQNGHVVGNLKNKVSPATVELDSLRKYMDEKANYNNANANERNWQVMLALTNEEIERIREIAKQRKKRPGKIIRDIVREYISTA